jgi:DNA-binding Xre family transcriptional regulator
MTDTLNGRAAANIRAQLAARRMTHEKLAEAAGISRGAVTAMLSEKTEIRLRQLELIAAALEVDPSTLLNS